MNPAAGLYILENRSFFPPIGNRTNDRPTTISTRSQQSKGEFFCHLHVMKGYNGSKNRVPHLLNFGRRSRRVISSDSQPPYLKKNDGYPPNRRFFNPLEPNDVYIRRTAQLTSRRCNLNIYSTNILTEYFNL